MLFSKTIRLLTTAVACATIVACGDAPLDPAGRMSAPSGISAVVGTTNLQVATFTVYPDVSGSYSFGPHRVYFPAQSICDPRTSGYGEDWWDRPCQPVRTPIVIRAAWTLRGEHAVVELEPALRFVPAAANDTSRWVVLTLHEPKSVDASLPYAIAWLRPWDMRWVDESLQDPTLRAWIDQSNNNVSRRLKHFSGYNVTAGFAQTTSACEFGCDDAGIGGIIQ